ncbi:MAG: 2-hydroxyglutaryl-CoA dehydratase [Nitrospira sp.]|nr:MAG: 2-hydroxyglutaryl-CoA dehydratase [Nitrospira sp.]
MNKNFANSDTMICAEDSQTLLDIDAELARFEVEERARLGLAAHPRQQWHDRVPRTFTASQRSHTTLLVSGLTMAHDLFMQSVLRGLGYNVLALDCPDNDSLRFGKEFGNRGQCNPTYFTVGNLVKYLHQLRAEHGMSVRDIVDRYVFITAGGCGPCRFGTYVTEYRKALRDSGFDGFRVLLFQQSGGLKQATGEELGLRMDPAFFLGVIKAVVVGDVLNALVYRIRPYEVAPGSTDEALARCKEFISDAFANGTSLMLALWRCRRLLAKVQVDRTRVKPKVAIIGEFWAMTTEGDGNYQVQRFLESEGAEVDIQLVTAWVLYTIWEGRYDTTRRVNLRGADGGRYGLKDVNVLRRLASLWVADRAIRIVFQSFAHLMGLRRYHLPDMDELAKVSHEFYDNHLRGGEGHMEVGKLVLNVVRNKVNMTLSVKPFGCMPSSGVSDGVQSLITEMYPQAIFLPIETSGDGAVNVYSRIQMQLFKAKQAAEKEVEEALSQNGLSRERVRAYVGARSHLRHALHRSPHTAGCTAADLVHEVARRLSPVRSLSRSIAQWISALLEQREKASHPEVPGRANTVDQVPIRNIRVDAPAHGPLIWPTRSSASSS